jgi:serine/threonine protein kinase
MSMIGKSLAQYEITNQLGKGGMGEVYQAKDQKLGRDVAIKVLPEEFARDTERVARFQREAKLLASLNHPNIAAIHGLEEANNTHFLVLELVEGQTLAERIQTGPIDVEGALKLGLQIAEALEAAHEKGVIHRDLKPANIKVTPDGKVKVLDFGLAKVFAGEQDQVSLSNSPTLSDMATQQGLILGTAAYMSPEQARGKPVDKRTDVWAFGCVLYEMLTGKAAFQGEDVTEILAAVVKSGVNLDRLPANIHPRITEVLSRCLQKEQKKRYADISDVQYEIERVLADPSGVFVLPVTATKPKKKLRVGIPWVAASIVVAVIITGIAVWILKPSPPLPPVHRYDYLLPEDQEFTGGSYEMRLTVSLDGTMIVYAANERLFLKKSNELTATPIRGSDEDPTHPFFSPDGQWVGYLSLRDDQFKKISINGGSSVKLCDAGDLAHPTWLEDDTILFGGLGGITLFSPGKGTTEEILKGEESEYFLWPQILPDGKSVLYTLPTEGEEFQAAVQSFESEEPKVLFPGGPARYLPTGHIVYGVENTLTAIRFDPDTLETIGGQVPVIEDVFRFGPNRATHVAISDSGSLIYIPGGMGFTAQGTLVWVDREGREEPIDEEPKAYRNPRISPDGTRVALVILADGNRDIHIYDLVRKTPTRLTRNEANDFLPIWTPDSKRIIFGSEREERQSICWKAADSTGEVEQLSSMPDAWMWPTSLSKDGNTLFFGQWNESGRYNIGILPMEGDRTPKLLLQEEYDERDPQISPDGRWLAYASDESDQWEVYVRPFPDVDSGGLKKVSTSGGNYPLWSPDGRELFYRSPDGFVAVSVETNPDLKLGSPQRLFDMEPYLAVDIDPDGKRFLMVKGVETAEDDTAQGTPRKIIVVTNWFEELKEKAPVE